MGPPEGASHLRHTSCLTPIASEGIEPATSLLRGLATGDQQIEPTLGDRWLLLLQEFDITIIDKPGKENVVADFLSRFTNSDDNLPVEDSFSR